MCGCAEHHASLWTYVTSVMAVSLQHVRYVPLLHTFSNNAKEYLITSAWLTHIATYVTYMHPVAVWHFWPISQTQHIIWMNNETLLVRSILWRSYLDMTHMQHICMHRGEIIHTLPPHTRAPLKMLLVPWRLNNESVSLFSVLSWSGLNAKSGG